MHHKLKRTILSSELADWCGLELIGCDYNIVAVGPLFASGDGILSFAKSIPDRVVAGAQIIIASKEAAKNFNCVLVAANPRLEFARALDHIEKKVGFEKSTADPIIHPSARIDPYSSIGAGVEIGARTVISPFSFIGDGTRIGSDCIIKSGAVIGQDGFGFERDESGRPFRIKHLGNVLIGNNVEVGSLTTICRGTLADTLVDDYAKIDDHVHIAHNVHIGESAMVVAASGLCGGVLVGSGAWIGPNSTVIQKRRIGPHSTVGIGATVLNDVPEGVTVAGYPGRQLPAKYTSG